MENGQPSTWERAKTQFQCNHINRHIAFYLNGGRRMYGWHCVFCGEFEVLRKATLSQSQIAAARLRNESIKKDFNEKRLAYWQQLESQRTQIQVRDKEREALEWRRRYDAHLLSPEWAELRRRVFSRAAGLCEGCRRRPPVQVHHLTYEHMGNEFLWELAAVCLECHRRVHAD